MGSQLPPWSLQPPAKSHVEYAGSPPAHPGIAKTLTVGGNRAAHKSALTDIFPNLSSEEPPPLRVD